MPGGLPLWKPPYSRMTAIDMHTGEHRWMTPTGNGDRFPQPPAASRPRSAPAGRRRRPERSAADPDPAGLHAHRRRRRRRPPARGLRQGEGRAAGRGRSAGRGHRHADDLPARRAPVYRRHGGRRGPVARGVPVAVIEDTTFARPGLSGSIRREAGAGVGTGRSRTRR